MLTAEQQHSIRSFVVRGRITPAQQRAVTALWPSYGVDLPQHELAFAQLFGREAERVVEIGFGNGESLLAQAQAHPEQDFLGIEAHKPGIGHALLRLQDLSLQNVRIMHADAAPVLARHIPANSIACLQIFFPDPWPKKRHHKRRLIQTGFITSAAQTLIPGGRLHLATDWQPYAEYMLEVLHATPSLANSYADFAPRPAHRPLTKFEQRGKKLGHGVWDMIFVKY